MVNGNIFKKLDCLLLWTFCFMSLSLLELDRAPRIAEAWLVQACLAERGFGPSPVLPMCSLPLLDFHAGKNVATLNEFRTLLKYRRASHLPGSLSVEEQVEPCWTCLGMFEFWADMHDCEGPPYCPWLADMQGKGSSSASLPGHRSKHQALCVHMRSCSSFLWP